MTSGTCHCGQIFEQPATGRRRIYCSPACYPKRLKAEPISSDCRICGAKFPSMARGRPAFYCSPACRNAARREHDRTVSTCLDCQESFTRLSRSSPQRCTVCIKRQRAIARWGERDLRVIEGEQFLRCTKCLSHQHIEEFGRKQNYRHERDTWCKDCHRAYKIALGPDYYILKGRQSKYGISPEDQRELWSRQGGRCAACPTKFENWAEAHLDHCHRTGRVRAFLCPPCNHIVGMCSEDVDHLVAVAEYLIAQRSLA